MICAFCGHEYEETEGAAACRSCVLAANCGRIRCPRCGYEDVRPSRIGRALGGRRRRMRKMLGAGRAGCPTLAELAPGARGTVMGLLHERQRGSQAERLTVLGVLPGTEIEVIRCWPAVVFQLGHSQFAVDEELAGLILVRPEGGTDGSS